MNSLDRVDVFIPCSLKDFPVMKRAIPLIVANVPVVGDIHVSMPDARCRCNFSIDGHNVYFHNDEDLVPRKYVNLCRFRPNWIY